MTRLMTYDEFVVAFPETEPEICDLCGDLQELRPYGPKGENICSRCGLKHIFTTIQAILGQITEIDVHTEQ